MASTHSWPLGDRSSAAPKDDPVFPGDGEMAARCRALDWSTTPLGKVEGWSHSLRTTVGVLLASRHPMFLWWGPELVQIYNDAYRPSFGAGGRHPRALGTRGREFWTDIWDTIGPQIEQVMGGGGATWHEDQYLPIERNGRLEDVWWTYGYSPVRDDDGRIGGTLVVCQETTGRVLAEQRLRALNRELEAQRAEAEEARRHTGAVLASISDAFIAFDREWRFTYVNDRAEHVLMRARDELLGRSLWEAYPPTIGTAFEREYRRAMTTGEPVSFEAHYEPLAIWFEVRAYPGPDGLAVYFQDVTARRAAAAALAESERQFRLVADAIPNLTWTARADGFIDWYNARWYEYTGTTPDEMQGWGWQRVHHPDVLPEVMERWTASIATGAPFEMTFPIRGADGAFRAFLTRVMPLRDDEGRVVRWFGTNTDVEAERAARAAAEAARARTERLQSLTAALAATHSTDEVAAVIVAEVVAAMGAATGMLAVRLPNRDEAAIVGQTGLDPAVIGAYARFPLSFPGPAARCLRTGEPQWASSRAEVLAQYSDIPEVWERLGTHAFATVPLAVGGEVVGAMSFTWTAPRALPTEDREFFVALGGQAAQAMERVRLLAAEQQARAAAESARRDAEAANLAKMQFLATMSHELRTPLNAIGGYAELMELGLRGPLTAQQRDDLGRIRTSQRHLLGLINEVLNYAKLETGTVRYDVEDVVVRDALAAAEGLVAPQVRARGLALAIAPCSPELAVRADAEKLRQVLANLLSNAVKFTAPGGRIELAATERAGTVNIVVRDTGIGIAADKLAAIFEPFVQVRADLTRTAEGTGLGLAISRDLARGMGGDLAVESTPGAGSAFTLTLPRA